jgi:dienelactone hydrolase
MKRHALRTVGPLLALLILAPALRADPTPAPSARKALELPDILAWKSISSATLSSDGQWLAYRIAPQEGDGEVVVRQTRGEKELRFPVGESLRVTFEMLIGGFVPPTNLAFSDDGKWLAFTVRPTAKEAKELQKQKKTAPGKVALVNPATGEKHEFEGVRRFAFSGESAGWLALHREPPESAPAAPATPGSGPASGGGEKPAGTDLILRHLATGEELNVGNVSEFAFDKPGRYLAVVIDAAGQVGNGVQLRHLASGTVRPLDSGKAEYKGLTWTEKGDALAVLKGVEDKAFKEKRFSLLGFADLTALRPIKVAYDPQADKTFPAGFTISPNRPPAWTDDLGTLLFGIHEMHKKDDGAKPEEKPLIAGGPSRRAPGSTDAVGPPARNNPGTPSADPDKPDLVIWHWGDRRLPSEQQTQAQTDRNYSYLSSYRVAEKTFHRLADESLRTVTPSHVSRWTLGFNAKPYELAGSLNGQRLQDVAIVDQHTGRRRPALTKLRWGYFLSPEGGHYLYYEDGHYHTLELATGEKRNITAGVPTSFVNTEDDHNVEKPPRLPVGWEKGGKSVLISDGWDVWQVPVHGGQGVNLTVNGKADGIRYATRYTLDPDEKGIDLSAPVYLRTYGEWTKKGGVSRIVGGKPGPERLLWDDAIYTLLKARRADVFAYTRETFTECPDYHVTDAALTKGKRITQANPQQSQFAWSPGTRLIDYTSAKGARLQAALFLPANYEPGRRYPTVVYIYEKLSQSLNRYHPPSATGFNQSVYTSNGYAVLMPDITYQVNDPGMSAVWCVLPALDAAIAGGVVDREKVALHGHSWGGYQTAFLITQTDAFKAAIAGAPLTDLVSMYSSVYWNTGWANQPIFESSQGRFTGGYSDEPEAYVRNSPVFHAKKVKTPLLLLHNDKDGAVDFNQGLEYFNTLRRLGKPVVMLQYRGENHGLTKAPNQKDYAVRMREFLDHHLRGKPAPDWLKDGVPYLKLEEHLKERAKDAEKKDEKKAAAPIRAAG